jgi:hypothetical protein
VKRLLILLTLLAGTLSLAEDEAAIIATLTGARKVTPTSEGFQLVSKNGLWMRAVRTVDGGYSIFSTNGSSRLFPTPMGFGFQAGSNDYRTVTRTQNGFSINDGSGTISMTKAGSAWIDRESTNNLRVIVNSEGYSVVSGPLAPMPADTSYELFMQHMQAASPDQQFKQPVPSAYQPQAQPIKIRSNLDKGR